LNDPKTAAPPGLIGGLLLAIGAPLGAVLSPSSISSAHPAAAGRVLWLRAMAMPEPIR